MTPKQLLVFWTHLKQVDRDLARFEKPPTGWKPKAVRDMTEDELQAFWSAFQQIMVDAATNIPENARDSDTVDSEEPASSSLVKRVEGPPPARRVRGKTSQVDYEHLSLEKIQEFREQGEVKQKGPSRSANGDRKRSAAVAEDGQPPKKRKYQQRADVKRTGKSSCVSIWAKVQLFQEYDRLKADPEIRFPEKHMLRTSRKQGQYQGCFTDSHWGKKRREHHWDLFCQLAPKQAKQMAEIPNSVRPLLCIEKMKHNNSKFSLKDGIHSVPLPLALALEQVAMERMQLGEEVTTDFVQNLLVDMIAFWNDQVAKLSEEVQSNFGPRILEDCDRRIESGMSEAKIAEIQNNAKDELERMLSLLQPCAITNNHANIKFLSRTNTVCVYLHH